MADEAQTLSHIPVLASGETSTPANLEEFRKVAEADINFKALAHITRLYARIEELEDNYNTVAKKLNELIFEMLVSDLKKKKAETGGMLGRVG